MNLPRLVPSGLSYILVAEINTWARSCNFDTYCICLLINYSIYGTLTGKCVIVILMTLLLSCTVYLI